MFLLDISVELAVSGLYKPDLNLLSEDRVANRVLYPYVRSAQKRTLAKGEQGGKIIEGKKKIIESQMLRIRKKDLEPIELEVRKLTRQLAGLDPKKDKIKYDELKLYRDKRVELVEYWRRELAKLEQSIADLKRAPKVEQLIQDAKKINEHMAQISDRIGPYSQALAMTAKTWITASDDLSPLKETASTQYAAQIAK